MPCLGNKCLVQYLSGKYSTVLRFAYRIVPYYGDSKLGDDSTFFSSAVNKGIAVLVNRYIKVAYIHLYLSLKRLKEEIHKFVLLPNMDDLPIRIMDPFPTSNVDEGVRNFFEEDNTTT